MGAGLPAWSPSSSNTMAGSDIFVASLSIEGHNAAMKDVSAADCKIDIPPRMGERHVVLVGFDGLQALDLVGPLEVFTKANLHMPVTGRAPFRYRVTIASPNGGEVVSEAGLVIARTVALRDLEDPIDTVLVGGGSEEGVRAGASSGQFIGWIAGSAGQIRRVGSVCTGAFLLGAAGLLDGRKATTHWRSRELLKELFPTTDVESDALFVADGNIYTSAGVTSGIDLTLAMVEQDCGPEVALAVARDLVLYLRRPGGQSQFSASLAAQAKPGGRLDHLLTWINEHPEEDLSLPSLADRAAMSERNFGRVFASQTGMTPACYVECVRLDRAKQLLESTDWPQARVAERSGFGTVPTLIRAFARRIGLTPDTYRKRFSIEPPGNSRCRSNLGGK